MILPVRHAGQVEAVRGLLREYAAGFAPVAPYAKERPELLFFGLALRS